MTKFGLYDYVQDKIPFNVYGLVLFKIRSSLNMSQKHFCYIMNINTVAYNKIESSISAGTTTYRKPTKLFYDRVCEWYDSLTEDLKDDISRMINSSVDVVEIYDPNANSADQYTAKCTLRPGCKKMSMENYSLKLSKELSEEDIYSIRSLLYRRGIKMVLYRSPD